MKVSAMLVAVSLSVSACATADLGQLAMGSVEPRTHGLAGGLDRSVPQAPLASPYAPLASSYAPPPSASLAATHRGPASFATTRTRHEDPLPPSSPPAAEPAGQTTLEALATSVVLLGAGIVYLGHKIKRGSNKDDGFTIRRGGWHSRARVRPTPTGLAVRF
ncbi:MAG: hypothetical protein AB7T06_03090 [Kofleriaceae bacterium]